MKKLLLLLMVLGLLMTAPISMAADDDTDPLSKFCIRQGRTDSPKIAITMDDCYEPEYVFKTVELCEEYGVAATFFPIGTNLRDEDAESWRHVIEAGCEIGSHGMVHNSFGGSAGIWDIITRLGKFQERLDQLLGYHYEVRWFRPPFGSIKGNDGTTSVFVRGLKTFGYDHAILWSVTDTEPDKALKHTRNGSILLFHARHKDYECIKTLLPQLLEAGFQPVTVSELLGFEPCETGTELFVYDKNRYRKK